jgi:hypothetical protein
MIAQLLKIVSLFTACGLVSFASLGCKSKAVKAPEAPETQVDKEKIERVMTFLNNTSFNCGPYDTSDVELGVSVYDEFKYDEKQNTLKWKERSGSLDSISGIAHEIDLKSVKPFVKLDSWRAPSVYEVTLLGLCKRTGLGYDREENGTHPDTGKTTQDDKALFIVDEKESKQLKAALEDLIKAHGKELIAY